jgi:hypothetical protein
MPLGTKGPEEAMRRSRAGTALLAVTLLGFLILIGGMTLVGVTTAKNRESYGLNRLVVCRYAAEGALHEVMFRARREAEAGVPGWFGQARLAADPILVKRIASPPSSQTADLPTVRVSIYDAAEAAQRLNIALGASEYIVESTGTLDGFRATLHLRMTYRVSVSSTTASTPAGLFSKYLLWTTSPRNTSSAWMSYNTTSDGYVHFEGDVRIGNKNARFGMPVTATGVFDYAPPPFVSSAWTTADQESLFDYDRNGTVDTRARRGYLNTSEAEAKNGSGGGKPSVPQPSYTDVEARFQAAAREQTIGDPALAGLWIDPSNPLYSSIGKISHCTVRLEHDTGSGQTTAHISVLAAAGSRSLRIALPTGKPLILLSSAKISSLSGTYYASLTIASTYAGAPTGVRQYGPFHDAPHKLPLLPVLGDPAITITDHVINVDQAGRPKYWVYDGGGVVSSEPPQPAPVVVKTPPRVELQRLEAQQQPMSQTWEEWAAAHPEAAKAQQERIAAESKARLNQPSSDPFGGSTSGTISRPSSSSSSGTSASPAPAAKPPPGPSSPSGPPSAVQDGVSIWNAAIVRRFARFFGVAQSRGNPYPAPGRLNLVGVPRKDVASSNVDDNSVDWNAKGWSFRRLASYEPDQPCVLGLYSRGDVMIKTSARNHIGMFAFYGGDPRARIYADPSTSGRHYNRAFLGSVVSPQSALSGYRVVDSAGGIAWYSGFTRGKFAMYDWDFLRNPPPYWIAPATSSTSSSSSVTVVFGAISHFNSKDR